MSATDWTKFADGLITDFGEEFGNGANNPPTYHVKETVSGGTSPIDPPTITTELMEMNAVFTTVSKSMIDGTLIKNGDVAVTSTYDGVINASDVIRRDNKDYIVITIDPVKPYGQSIVKKMIARAK